MLVLVVLFFPLVNLQFSVLKLSMDGKARFIHSSVLMDQIYFLFVVVESDEFKYCL